MDKKEYLEIVMEQIRFARAKSLVAAELEVHIEDQKLSYMEEGDTESEAYEKAVREMGNPIDVGVAMDRLHRPKMEWRMLTLVVAFSALGLLIQTLLCMELGADIYGFNIMHQITYTVIGIAVMLVCCYLDYSRIGACSKIGAAVTILLLLVSIFGGLELNGQRGYLVVGSQTISMHMLTYLYVPFFGGILYQYKNQGNRGLLKSILWMLMPVILSAYLPNITLSGSLFIIMAAQICFVMQKGWFEQTKGRKFMISAALFGSPLAAVLSIFCMGEIYQRDRILGMFVATKSSGTVAFIRSLLRDSSMLGRSGEHIEEVLPSVGSDYILTYIVSCYGVLAALILTGILAYIIYKSFRITVRQKNQLGLVIGFGCSMILAVQSMLCVLVNIALIPGMKVYLPLISYGGGGTVVSYALIGILLSIYRYQSVIPAYPVAERMKMKNI